MTVKLFVHNDHPRRPVMGIRMGYLPSAVFALALLTSAPTLGRAQQPVSAADPDAPLPLADDGQYPATVKFATAVGQALGNAALGKLGGTAVEFATKLLGLTGPSEIELAKKEIIAAIHDAEGTEIRGYINGSMDRFQTVLRDPVLNASLLDGIMQDMTNMVGEIEDVIKTRRNADLAYQVAPALTVAIAVLVAVRQMKGEPADDIRSQYQKMMDLGMDLVGVDFLYDEQNRAVRDSGDSKLLWKLDRLREEWHTCTSPAARDESYYPVRCSSRNGSYCYKGLGFLTSLVSHSDCPKCWQETLASARRAFNKDDVVRTVKIAMLQAYAKGLDASGVRRPYLISHCLSAAANGLVDFDGDCTQDVAIWRSSEAAWYVRPSKGANTYSISFENPTDIPVVGDFDGDRKTDIAVWRPSDGNWLVMSSKVPGAPPIGYEWGIPGDAPVAGDYDGDGISDLAVWRPSEGRWYVWPSGGAERFWAQWGEPGDIPVPADYDGDGRTDMALWRPSNGTWYIWSSATNNTYPIQWGQAGDVPVPADYDGDGRTDPAVVRPSDSGLYVLPSNGVCLNIGICLGGSYFQPQISTPSDIKLAGDYDGDGQAELIIWGRSDGIWWSQLSATYNKTLSQQWGVPGDIPLGAQWLGDPLRRGRTPVE